MPNGLQPQTRRSSGIDALRGIAVFGILLVNIPSFIWGADVMRFGVLPQSASLLDKGVVFLVSFLAEVKFYPIFAFLFGAGFALQTRSFRRVTGDWDTVRELFRRRFTWLLICGIVHGVLIWLGDILTVYALAGFWMINYAGVRLREMKKSVLRWAVAAFVMLVATALVFGSVAADFDRPDDLRATLFALEEARRIYTQGNAFEIGAERIADYISLTISSLWLLPHTILMFLLGIFAVRLGWIVHPQRHRQTWWRMLKIGIFVGLPLNFFYGVFSLQQALHPQTYAYVVSLLQALIGPTLSVGYVAAVMLAGPKIAAWLEYWLAPVGRMALTNYLAQSVLCVLILQGTGLGWGSAATPFTLLMIAIGIMSAQMLWSRAWLATHAQGPLETLWRRYTYGRG